MKSKLIIVNKYLEPMLKAMNSSIEKVDYLTRTIGDQVVDEEVNIIFNTGNFIKVNVTRDSQERLVLDVMNAII